MTEVLDITERVIVSPAVGEFRPFPPRDVTTEGEIVYRGQDIGVVLASGEEVPVTSPFTGFFMGMLAAPSERVREGQPIAWLRET